MFALSALKTYRDGNASEYIVLVMNQLYSVVATYVKKDVSLVTQRAIDGRIFVTYLANETIAIDVLQYGTVRVIHELNLDTCYHLTICFQPPVTPVSPPLVLTPSATPSDVPSISLSPQAVPPSKSPEASVSPGLASDATIAVGVVVSVGGAGLVIFFIVFFAKRNKAKKEEKKQRKFEDEGKTKYEAIQLNNPVANITNTSSSVSSGAFDAEAIDKRLRIPYKRLKFIKEIGSGSYGKVFYG